MVCSYTFFVDFTPKKNLFMDKSIGKVLLKSSVTVRIQMVSSAKQIFGSFQIERNMITVAVFVSI